MRVYMCMCAIPSGKHRQQRQEKASAATKWADKMQVPSEHQHILKSHSLNNTVVLRFCSGVNLANSWLASYG